MGGRAGNTALPSAAELLKQVGVNRSRKAVRNDIEQMMSPNTYSQYQGLPTAASKGEFSFSDVISTYQYESSEFYDPKTYQYTEATNLAGLPIDYEQLASRKHYDVDDDTDDVIIPGMAGPSGYTDSEAPAQLSVVPTSTTNPKRPRTVAAGYDKDRRVITVVFRDGTWYNYYDCAPNTWQDFKARVSKGRYIYRYLDFHPRGPADVSAFSAEAQEIMYRVVRTAQIHLEGKQFRGAKKTKPTNPSR